MAGKDSLRQGGSHRLKMTGGWAFPKAKSDHVFGQRRNQADQPNVALGNKIDIAGTSSGRDRERLSESARTASGNASRATGNQHRRAGCDYGRFPDGAGEVSLRNSRRKRPGTGKHDIQLLPPCLDAQVPGKLTSNSRGLFRLPYSDCEGKVAASSDHHSHHRFWNQRSFCRRNEGCHRRHYF